MLQPTDFLMNTLIKYDKKKYIWFDIGYTLLYLKREELFISCAEKRNISLPSKATVAEAFHLTDKLFMKDYPGVLGKEKETYMPWYFGHLSYQLGIRLGLCSFYHDWKSSFSNSFEMWNPFPDVLPTLQYMKDKGYKMGVISNWDKSARALLERHHLTSFFDTIIISSEVGVEKPSREIFNHALTKAEVSPQECLYIGDNYYDDAVGSSKVGMESLIINRYGEKGVEEISGCNFIGSISELKNHL